MPTRIRSPYGGNDSCQPSRNKLLRPVKAARRSSIRTFLGRKTYHNHKEPSPVPPYCEISPEIGIKQEQVLHETVDAIQDPERLKILLKEALDTINQNGLAGLFPHCDNDFQHSSYRSLCWTPRAVPPRRNTRNRDKMDKIHERGI